MSLEIEGALTDLSFQALRPTGLSRSESRRRIAPGREIGTAILSLLDSETPFLLSIIDDLHSIVLVGSGASDRLENGSDLDIAIIPECDRYERVADALVDRAILAHYEKGRTKIEYTPLDTSQAERHFRTGSPFAFALRRGIHLWDDGFLKRLVSDHAETPGKEYYLDALRDSVVLQYFGIIKWFEDELMNHHGRDGRCTRKGRCLGHSPADNLARVIINMLYVALPRHGYMPLMKKDLLRFSADVYGPGTAELVGKVIRIERNGIRSIKLCTFSELKTLAERLFQEIVSIVEIRDEAGQILKEATRAIKAYISAEEGTVREFIAA